MSGDHLQRTTTDPVARQTIAMTYEKWAGSMEAKVDGMKDAAYRRAAEQLAKALKVDTTMSYGKFGWTSPILPVRQTTR